MTAKLTSKSSLLLQGLGIFEALLLTNLALGSISIMYPLKKRLFQNIT